jgi:hypothetical protein
MPHSDLFASAFPVSETRQPSPFDGLLEKSRDLTCERLGEAVAIMLDSANDVITQLLKDTQVREELRLYEEARELVTQERETIEQHFRKAYRAEFQRRSNRARKIGKPFEQTEHSIAGLELVGEEDYDETLKFNAMADKVRNYCEEELSGLDQRVGVLLGNAALESQDNPFSPNVICDAFKSACRHLEVSPPVRGVLLKLFDDEVLDEIRSVYKAVNALLVRNSILPQIRYNVARRSDSASAGHAASSLVPAASRAAGDAPAGMPPQELFAILQSLFTANGAAGGHASGVGPNTAMTAAAAVPAGNVVVMQGLELLDALTRIQRGDFASAAVSASGEHEAGSAAPFGAAVAGSTNLLHQLKTSDVGAGMNPLDRMTLDIIAMLFDELFDDPKVPNAIKALIGRLQIPMLKVAIADKTFFSTKSHPARKLLDAVGDVALRLPADFSDTNPLFARIERLLQHLVDDYREELPIFTKVHDELLALMAEEDLRIEQEAQVQAKRVEELEQLSLARAAAQKEVLARVRVRELPPAVLNFIAQEWIKLLLLVHAKDGGESGAWSEALIAMDELIWSVEPKNGNEERRKLASLIPSLVKRLTAGLQRAGTDDGVRAGFFAELMQCHMQALSAAPRAVPKAAVAAPATAQSSAPIKAESAPAQAATAAVPQAAGTAPAQEAGESLDFATPITVQNPFGGGEVAVDDVDLDFTAEVIAGAKAKREASIRRAIDNLKTGHWIEFRDPQNEGKTKPGRLIFISPQKTRYLFAIDRAGTEIIQCSRGEVVRRFLTGQAVKLDEPPEESLFDRIMNGLLCKLRLSERPAAFAP